MKSEFEKIASNVFGGEFSMFCTKTACYMDFGIVQYSDNMPNGATLDTAMDAAVKKWNDVIDRCRRVDDENK